MNWRDREYEGGIIMKTIKERAKEYAPDPLDPDYILPTREEYIVKQQRQAYIAGATEQKAIDIEKACNWLFLYVGLYVNDKGYVETHELLRDLSKAMEE